MKLSNNLFKIASNLFNNFLQKYQKEINMYYQHWKKIYLDHMPDEASDPMPDPEDLRLLNIIDETFYCIKTKNLITDLDLKYFADNLQNLKEIWTASFSSLKDDPIIERIYQFLIQLGYALQPIYQYNRLRKEPSSEIYYIEEIKEKIRKVLIDELNMIESNENKFILNNIKIVIDIPENLIYPIKGRINITEENINLPGQRTEFYNYKFNEVPSIPELIPLKEKLMIFYKKLISLFHAHKINIKVPKDYITFSVSSIFQTIEGNIQFNIPI